MNENADHRFTVALRTGTYADVLEAIGRASLLREVGAGSDVTIKHEGQEVVLSCLDSVGPEGWHVPAPGYPYVWLRSKQESAPRLLEILDYESERQKRDARRAWESSLKKAEREGQELLETQAMQAPPQPSPWFSLASLLASMRKGWRGDTDLAEWIAHNPDRSLHWVRARLAGIAFKDEPRISNSQVLNPISGKGVHVPKTEARAPSSLPAKLLDPFAEWMKIRGLWKAALAFRVDDDFKFFVLEPADLRIGALEGVLDELRRRNLWGGIRLDIEATLRCVEVLIRRSEAYRAEGKKATEDSLLSLKEILGKRPSELIAGLRLAYFKSLGTASSTFRPNTSTTRLGRADFPCARAARPSIPTGSAPTSPSPKACPKKPKTARSLRKRCSAASSTTARGS